MSNSHLRKAVGNTLIGVVGRLFLFCVAALIFLTLVEMREWKTSYATSPAWANAIAKKSPKWSGVLSAAVNAIGSKPYQSEETLYSDIKAKITETKVGKDPNSQIPKLAIGKANQPLLDSYIKLRQERDKKRVELKDFLAPSEEALSQTWKDLKTTNESIDKKWKEIAGLEEGSKRMSAAEAELGRLRHQRTDKLNDIRELSSARAAIEALSRRELGEIESNIESAEQDIRKAFDAAVPSARPVDVFVIPIIPPGLLIEIGDEGSPYNILYVVAWYCLEGIIVLLICIAFVPWILVLGRGKSDPTSIESFRERLTTWLANAFRATATGMIRVLATAAVGTIAVAGALAAGEPPPLSSILHDGGGADGQAGKAGEPGEQGEPGNSGTNGANGVNGENGTGEIPSELKLEIARQRKLIEDLQGGLDEAWKQDQRNKERLRALEHDQLEMIANTTTLLEQMQTILSNSSRFNDRVASLAAANQSILFASDTMNRRMISYLGDIRVAAEETESHIKRVGTEVDKASDVPATTADLLQLSARRDSAFTRFNPLHRYHVTPEVVDTVGRAMRKTEDAKNVEVILAALRDMMTNGAKEFKLKSFHAEIRRRTPESSRPILNRMMPLIEKLSRIQR